MQALWTRAAQARCLCNCPTCVSTTTAIARRTATASARQRLGRPDVFTVFSSTLALSAAVMDSARKEARNRQWEKVIGETRAEVEATELDQERRIAALAEAQEQCDIKQRPSAEVPMRLIAFHRRNWVDVVSWAAVQEGERAAAGFQDWRGVPLELLQTLSESDLQQLLSDKRLLHRFYGGPNCSSLVADAPSWAMSKKKLRTTEWSMLKLVLRLLLHSAQQSGDNDYQPTTQTVSRLLSRERVQWQETKQDAERRLEQLFSEDQRSRIYEDFPSPEAPHYEYTSHECEGEMMKSNIALQAILGELTATATSKISKICAHLLLLRVVPNIHTYNLLLVRFCQLQDDVLVLAVLDSMRESHVRPNEITHATILRFFTITDDRDGFRLYLKQMNGRAQGLALAHPEREIHPIAKSRYHAFGIHKHKFAEKARMNVEVYSSAIVGCLKIFRRDEAMWYYRKMTSEGWKPTMEILTAVLQDCHGLADFVSGLKIWELIQVLKVAGVSIGKIAYKYMLNLCERFEEEVLYHQILEEGIQSGVLTTISPDTLPTTTKHFCVEAPLNAVTASREHPTLPISSRLHRKYRNIPTRVINDLLAEVPTNNDLDERLRTLDQSLRQQRKLHRATSRIEMKYETLTNDIADLTHEVTQSLQLGDKNIIKYGVIAKVTNLDRDSYPEVVQRAYNDYRKMIERQASKESSTIDSWAPHRIQIKALPPPWLGTPQLAPPSSTA
ncbi:MAG: hypothetical protein Q9164_002198 [Protoblastenia rupestris]